MTTAYALDAQNSYRLSPEETFLTDNRLRPPSGWITRGGNGSDERDRYIEINTFPLLDRGNRVVQVVEYIKDVSEKMRLADRLEHARRLAELGEMAARVAHEVRNPLNAIAGAAHFLAEEYAGDETLQKFISLIKRQAVRVNQVASDLLYVSKPLRTRLTTLNINAVFDQALDALCEQLKDQHISVVQEMSPIMPLIEADELQIEQVLHNLLRNAVEAMPEGTLWGTAVGAGGTADSIQDGGPHPMETGSSSLL
jgi:signal transduction histidine kinase